MQIRRLTIRRFRGIKELDWDVGGVLICLIGPGDSTKSTILDAIELVLSTRWNPALSDTDFYMEDVREPIEITATVGRFPEDFLSDDKFGLVLRGWNQSSGLRDEPSDDDEPVLSVRFRTDSSLEPSWTVVNDRIPEGRPISLKDRERLGVVRLGAEVDRHLSWGRGSALTRITTGQINAMTILAEANRKAREMVGTTDTTDLKTAAQKTQKAAERLGVRPLADFQPALDTKATVGGLGALSIYEGTVPVRMRGLGTRRLIALALQTLSVRDGAVVLVDETETALEPHRIRHLLLSLQKATKAVPGGEDLAIGQVLMTTHSHTVITTLPVDNLFVVRSVNGRTEVQSIDTALQATVRKNPEALLGRKVIVCEGRTELGLCWALEEYWSQAQGGLALAYVGTVPVDGGGTTSPKIAEHLAGLGYAVALFRDSDVALQPAEQAQLQAKGVSIIQWSESVSTEQRIAHDVPWEHFTKIVSLAMEIKTPESVRDAVFAQLGVAARGNDTSPDVWVSWGHTQETIRTAFAKAAKKRPNEWFKALDNAQAVGKIVSEALPTIQGTNLCAKLTELGQWAYA